jgi:hypothetical protein
MRLTGSDVNEDQARKKKRLFMIGNVLFVYLRSTDLIKKLSGGEYGTRIKRKDVINY